MGQVPLGRRCISGGRSSVKLTLALVAAWAVFELAAGKVILNVLAPINAEIFDRIAQAIASVTH